MIEGKIKMENGTYRVDIRCIGADLENQEGYQQMIAEAQKLQDGETLNIYKTRHGEMYRIIREAERIV